MLEMQMTYHAKVERADRIRHIEQEIGFGQIIKEKYVMQAGAGKYICLTDTGVTIIKTEDKLCMITAYVTTQRSSFSQEKS